MRIAIVTMLFAGLMILGIMTVKSGVKVLTTAQAAQDASLAEALR